jgi:hypothetical protein
LGYNKEKLKVYGRAVVSPSFRESDQRSVFCIISAVIGGLERRRCGADAVRVGIELKTAGQ